MKFDDFISDFILILNGIGQGDPLSMLLYIIYNADLLELKENPREDSLGYIDDALVMAKGDDLEETVEILTDFMTREEGGFAWAKAHNSTFAIDKLAVTHFTRRRTVDLERPGRTIIREAPALILRGEPVKVLQAYKYLGIYVDSQLNWKIQTQEVISKATKWTLLYKWLMKPASGLSARFMKCLYLTVAVPKMTYGLDIWYTPPSREPGKKRSSGSVKALKELSKLQHTAALAMIGTLRTTPTDLLDAHAGLLPMDPLLKKICFRTLTHLCSLPPSNPVASQVSKYHARLAKRHITNIQHLLKLLQIDPLSLEDILVTTKPPSYRFPMDIMIADSKEDSLEDKSKDEANIRIYTDGSCQNGMVGVAAILYYPRNGTICTTLRLLCFHLGLTRNI